MSLGIYSHTYGVEAKGRVVHELRGGNYTQEELELGVCYALKLGGFGVIHVKVGDITDGLGTHTKLEVRADGYACKEERLWLVKGKNRVCEVKGFRSVAKIRRSSATRGDEVVGPCLCVSFGFCYMREAWAWNYYMHRLRHPLCVRGVGVRDELSASLG
ncbi:unnamed protein product [Dovyalis caffra]|uniref:Uncharacterized protein n=1 Tax=Dovyalis caffra TaxID=77055 RepID=A0AAV1RZX8_9ROSI|nr:unnamed protein product [Dovyalis caffra]